jgi:hypothetical protein
VPLLYADTSAIVGAYVPDEPDHRTLNRLLLAGDDPIVTSELTLVEFGSAMARAHRAHRVTDPDKVVANFVADCSNPGVFCVVTMTSGSILPLARKLTLEHRLRSLDAIHLATALIRGISFAGTEDFAMVTRDQRQTVAAKACGLRTL